MGIFVVACLCEFRSAHLFKWDIGSALCHASYFCVGYVIREKVSKHKNNFKGVMLVIVGFLSLVSLAYLRYKKVTAIIDGITYNEFGFSSPDAPSPIVTFSSILIF